jgi:hypothetical protein
MSTDATTRTGESQAAAAGKYEPCANCGAPLEASQRYCVNCAARRPDAVNPATQYLQAGGARRNRPPVATGTGAARRPENPTSRMAAVVFFALLPIAVGIGILVGRGGNDDSKLIDALHDIQGTAVASTNPADSGALTDTGNAGTVTSDWSLDKGYTVKLDLLPVASTNQDAVDSAKKDAEGKGAKDVGVINPSDFVTKPDQGQKDYVLYSGEFKSKGDATKAVAKLKKDFPDATVIEVDKPKNAANQAATPPTEVLAHTAHGDVHKVAGSKPTKEQADAGAQIAQDQANSTGEDYIKQQQGLPDVVVVGGDPNSAPDPTGAGD